MSSLASVPSGSARSQKTPRARCSPSTLELDEDEVLEELAMLETEIQGTQDPGFTVQDAVDLPVAPNNPIGTGASKDGVIDDEIAEEDDGRVLVAA